MGTPASPQTIRNWLDEAHYRLRKIRKDIPGGRHPDRNTQFEQIAELIDKYEADGNPWFSMDTKAKEHQGKLYRAGRVRSSSPFLAFDHDFPSWADGVIIHTAFMTTCICEATSISAFHATRLCLLAIVSSGTGIGLANNVTPMRHRF